MERSSCPPPLLGLEDDAISASLGLLDARSLIRAEKSNKRFKGAAEGAWIELDTSLEKNENEVRADGPSARERAIKSSIEYRYQVASRYAKEVDHMSLEDMRNAPLQPLLLGGGLAAREERAKHDYFIRFSYNEESTSTTSLLAHGFFRPVDFDGNALTFNLNDCDITGWPEMQKFLSWFDRNDRVDGSNEMKNSLKEVFLPLNVTVVAIHRRTLSGSIMFKKSSDALDLQYSNGKACIIVGTMQFFVAGQAEVLTTAAEGDNRNDAVDRYLELLFGDDWWGLEIYH